MNRKCFLSIWMVIVVVVCVSSFVLAQKAPEIPSGTTIKIRTVDRLSSEEARIGDKLPTPLWRSRLPSTIKNYILVGQMSLVVWWMCTSLVA
jgi:hypothetical protein